jgi:hypothetical protein
MLTLFERAPNTPRTARQQCVLKLKLGLMTQIARIVDLACQQYIFV